MTKRDYDKYIEGRLSMLEERLARLEKPTTAVNTEETSEPAKTSEPATKKASTKTSSKSK